MASLLTGSPGAENTVRRAREADLAAIGAVQARSWGGPYAQVLPHDVVAALDPAGLATAWRSAVADPPSAAHTVHVALGDGIVAGFAAAAPAAPEAPAEEDADEPRAGQVHADVALDDVPLEDGAVEDVALEVVALEVDPLHTRRGHGSRLLAAVADTARAAGARRLEVWVHVDDAPRAAFLRGAGFAEDGARRRRALDDADPGDGARSVWPEVRFVAWLVEE